MAFFILSFVCFLTGGSLFAVIPLVTQYEMKRFAQSEVYFLPPVPMQKNTLILRGDTYGKGYFGASRNGGRTHKGIDLLLETGKPIYAAKTGRVTISSYDKGYGLFVEIYHPDGHKTRYAHLSTLNVSEGQWITRGSIVGLCGKTGNADDPRILPHVHFEIRKDDVALDPAKVFDPEILVR